MTYVPTHAAPRQTAFDKARSWATEARPAGESTGPSVDTGKFIHDQALNYMQWHFYGRAFSGRKSQEETKSKDAQAMGMLSGAQFS